MKRRPNGQYDNDRAEAVDVTLVADDSEEIGESVAASYGDKDRRTLLDIIAFAELAEDLVSRGKDAYDADIQLQLAGEAIQHRIGGAVSRLSDEIVEDHTNIRFRTMKKARNLVAHNYDIVNPEIVWNTLALEFPKDAVRIRRMFGD